jgi:predicted nucleic-acid-binding Zn-ribbon protein
VRKALPTFKSAFPVCFVASPLTIKLQLKDIDYDDIFMSDQLRCPKCGSLTRYRQENIPIPNFPVFNPLPDLIKRNYNMYTIYICANPKCGYLEIYLK